MTAPEAAPKAAYSGLMRAIAGLYRQEAAAQGPGAAMLGRAAAAIEALDLDRPRLPTGARKPVCRHMGAALEEARLGPLAGLAQAFAAVERLSGWLQNPNYTEAAMGAAFLANYGYVELVGPGRPYDSAALLVGFLLLGPGAEYPEHLHEAEETYHVVAGAAEWKRAGSGWRVEPAGAAIHHRPNEAHAMRPGKKPLLALYCWAGAIGQAARLSG
jgi:mannose-6-phosphate isomerase-like protein (cupin superfamily)